MRRIFKKLPAP